MKELLFSFFKKVGKTTEVELFLKAFQGIPRFKFALITISAEVIKSDLDTLAENIAMMNRLEIYPILILNLPATAILTKSEEIQLKRNFTLTSHKLIKAVRRKKGHIQVLSDVLGWNPKTNKITVNQSKINQSLAKSNTPIIHPICLKNGIPTLISADLIAQKLVKLIKPKKYILLSSDGGILDKQLQIIPFLNLSVDRELQQSIHPDMKPQVRKIKEFIKKIPATAVVVTSAQNLLKEIFTVKGHGTFIKHHLIESTSHLEDLNKKKIRILLEEAFEKHLTDDYFTQNFQTIFYQKDYEGIAIVQEILGIPYLDKFAVSKLCEGTGLGKSLWQKVTKKFPQLIWRSTPHNPLNTFYLRECHGCIKGEHWHIFWRNLPQSTILDLVDAVATKPATLTPR